MVEVFLKQEGARQENLSVGGGGCGDGVEEEETVGCWQF